MLKTDWPMMKRKLSKNDIFRYPRVWSDLGNRSADIPITKRTNIRKVEWSRAWTTRRMLKRMRLWEHRNHTTLLVTLWKNVSF